MVKLKFLFRKRSLIQKVTAAIILGIIYSSYKVTNLEENTSLFENFVYIIV